MAVLRTRCPYRNPSAFAAGVTSYPAPSEHIQAPSFVSRFALGNLAHAQEFGLSSCYLVKHPFTILVHPQSNTAVALVRPWSIQGQTSGTPWSNLVKPGVEAGCFLPLPVAVQMEAAVPEDLCEGAACSALLDGPSSAATRTFNYIHNPHAICVRLAIKPNTFTTPVLAALLCLTRA